MSNNENDQITSMQPPTEPSSDQNNSSSDDTKKSPALLIILIILILAIISIFGYMIGTAMHDDAIDESVAAEKLQEAEARAQLTLDAEGNVITQDQTQSENIFIDSGNSFISKLINAEPVSILIIGDVYGTGAGASDGSNWSNIIIYDIKEAFGSDVTVNNLSLSTGNDAYSAYVTLMNESAGNPSSNYDAVIVSLGYYDDPFKFNLQYEGVLRSITKRYPSAQIIGIIESGSITSSEGNSDETAIYARTLLEHYDGIVANMGEAFAVSGTNTALFTDDGILPNESGQKIYSSWIVKQIQNRISGDDNKRANGINSSALAAKDSTGSIEPVNSDSVLYDHYYYISESSFLRLDDTNYIIGIDDLTSLGAETTGLIGLDYDYLNGPNIAQVVIDGNIFGGLSTDYEGAEAPERHIIAVNNNAIITDHIAVSFASKEQADTFHGLIITGNINLSNASGKYKQLPLPPETTAAPAESESNDTPEPSPEETNSDAEAETTEDEESNDTPESSPEETKKSSTKKKSDSTKKSSTRRTSSSDDEDEENTTEEGSESTADTVLDTTAETTSDITTTETSAETASIGATTGTETSASETTAAQTDTTTVGTSVVEAQTPLEGAIISDPSDSASLLETTSAYIVDAGHGIDLEQWNSSGPTVG